MNLKIFKKYSDFSMVMPFAGVMLIMAYFYLVKKTAIKEFSIILFNFTLLYLAEKEAKKNIHGKIVLIFAYIILGSLLYVFYY